MPHYSNGAPAQLFDIVTGFKDYQGRPATGCLLAIPHTGETCNGIVGFLEVKTATNEDGTVTSYPVISQTTVTLKDLLPVKAGDGLSLQQAVAATT